MARFKKSANYAVLGSDRDEAEDSASYSQDLRDRATGAASAGLAVREVERVTRPSPQIELTACRGGGPAPGFSTRAVRVTTRPSAFAERPASSWTSRPRGPARRTSPFRDGSMERPSTGSTKSATRCIGKNVQYRTSANGRPLPPVLDPKPAVRPARREAAVGKGRNGRIADISSFADRRLLELRAVPGQPCQAVKIVDAAQSFFLSPPRSHRATPININSPSRSGSDHPIRRRKP